MRMKYLKILKNSSTQVYGEFKLAFLDFALFWNFEFNVIKNFILNFRMMSRWILYGEFIVLSS